MRGRKEHVITAVKGDAQPYRLVGLAADADLHGAPGEVSVQCERLRCWASAGWERNYDGSLRRWSKAHADLADWHRAIRWAAKRPGVTWIVACRAVRLASLLGLWGMIEREQVKWDVAEKRPGHRRMPDAVVPGLQGCDGDRAEGQGSFGVGALPEVPPDGADDAGDRRSHLGFQVGYPAGIVIDDPPTIIRLRVPGLPGRVWLMDSRNWGIDIPGDLGDALSEARWLASAMERMCGELVERGWGGLKATAGSQALATWRRAYMTHDVTCHNDDAVLDLERAAYVGGRCEAFRLGRVAEDVVVVDRHSAYAHACSEWDVPLRVRSVTDGGRVEDLQSESRGRRCLAQVCVETGEAAYPCSLGGRHLYPTGRLRLTLCGPELSDAIAAGVVRSVGRVVEYDCGPALRDYARAVFDARRDFAARGDGALEAWSKRLLVGLPGKLGQRVADWRPIGGVDPPAPWCCWWGVTSELGLHRRRSLNGGCAVQTKAGWTYDAAPAVACWVMSAARVELLRAIRAAGRPNVLYTDTDSLFLTRQGWENLKASPGFVGDGLGQWRVVREPRHVDILGVKYYVCDGDVTCAGAPGADTADTRLLDHYWYRTTFGQALAEYSPPSAGRRLRRHRRAPSYSLGSVGDGGRVEPFYREDW